MPREPRSIRVEAVVLRHTELGEVDRIITLFSRQRGKLRAVAKGIRRPRSRKAGHLEPFTWVSLQLARGRDLWIVTQAETVLRWIWNHMSYRRVSKDDAFLFHEYSDYLYVESI